MRQLIAENLFLHLFQLCATALAGEVGEQERTACAVQGARFLVFGLAVLHSNTGGARAVCGWCPNERGKEAGRRAESPKPQGPSRRLFRHKNWLVLCPSGP